ncbi:uncharacterized protein LOC128997896 isoform X2 [Macrosteles quadrilineatus]|uniref:uncharacterized protein LOC128997896 isoform X2 n=1 Tax=Macrosteles quadrilineatus TaxID=74068 RepID=UPI0023E0E091|nr:uncharacterized protein LOC128997896 isoform X2 [Macrosteles quadrilineatus]
MGKTHAMALQNTMIDTTTKQQVVVVGEREKSGKKKQSSAFREPQRRHNAINLPKNLIDSDSEDYDEDNSSEDENDDFPHNGYLYDGNSKITPDQQVICKFETLSLDEKQSSKDKLVQKLEAIAKKYKESDTQAETDSKPKGLKARSPYRNRLNEHKHKPFERHDLSVTTALGNGGRVFVQSLAAVVPEPVANFPKDNMLLDAIQDKDFIASFMDLSSDEAEQVFLNFIELENKKLESEGQVVPQDVLVPQVSVMSPRSSLTPAHSPNNLDFYDSSYETGSPGSTVVTSPGSPGQPRSSVSSESDQELDPAMETVRAQLPTQQTNIVIIPATVVTKSEPKMRPLGEVVNYISTSASQRLYDLSKSTSFCVKHFTIQLVRVVMTTKAENAPDRIAGFCKSLMSTMKTEILNKPHEGDIWQLSIYAHIQFLTAPDRMHEYRSALKTCDERGHPLLYIAAVKRHERPLIARYIAESMAQVGYNPSEPMDDAGNTILHLVAEQGDSHMHVLSELLMAVGPNNKPLLNVMMPNSVGQTPMHAAARSPYTQVTTLLQLLKMGAQPLDLDQCDMTPLHYYIQGMSSRGGCHLEELEVVRKMLQAPMCLNKKSMQIVERLLADGSVPADVVNVIVEEVNRNCSKDLRPKKIDRR